MWQGSLHQPASWSRWRGRSQGPRGKEYTEPHHQPLQTLNEADFRKCRLILIRSITLSPAQGNLGKHRASFSRIGPAHLWFAHSTLVAQISSNYQTNIVRLSDKYRQIKDKMFCFCSPFPSLSWWQLGWLRSLGFDGDQTQELPPWEFDHILTFSTHLVTMSRAPLVAQ